VYDTLHVIEEHFKLNLAMIDTPLTLKITTKWNQLISTGLFACYTPNSEHCMSTLEKGCWLSGVPGQTNHYSWNVLI